MIKLVDVEFNLWELFILGISLVLIVIFGLSMMGGIEHYDLMAWVFLLVLFNTLLSVIHYLKLLVNDSKNLSRRK